MIPRPGWFAWNTPADRPAIFDGAAWIPAIAALGGVALESETVLAQGPSVAATTATVVGRRGGRAMTGTLDRIRTGLVGLRMPCTLEALDHPMRQLERGEIGALEAIEAIDALLSQEHATRQTLLPAQGDAVEMTG